MSRLPLLGMQLVLCRREMGRCLPAILVTPELLTPIPPGKAWANGDKAPVSNGKIRFHELPAMLIDETCHCSKLGAICLQGAQFLVHHPRKLLDDLLELVPEQVCLHAVIFEARDFQTPSVRCIKKELGTDRLMPGRAWAFLLMQVGQMSQLSDKVPSLPFQLLRKDLAKLPHSRCSIRIKFREFNHPKPDVFNGPPLLLLHRKQYRGLAYLTVRLLRLHITRKQISGHLGRFQTKPLTRAVRDWPIHLHVRGCLRVGGCLEIVHVHVRSRLWTPVRVV